MEGRPRRSTASDRAVLIPVPPEPSGYRSLLPAAVPRARRSKHRSGPRRSICRRCPIPQMLFVPTARSGADIICGAFRAHAFLLLSRTCRRTVQGRGSEGRRAFGRFRGQHPGADFHCFAHALELPDRGDKRPNHESRANEDQAPDEQGISKLRFQSPEAEKSRLPVRLRDFDAMRSRRRTAGRSRPR